MSGTAITEEEARKKWCPMARHPEGNRVPYGGDGTESADGDKAQFAIEMADLHPCIASDCMMWRWSRDNYEFAQTKNTAEGYFFSSVPPEGDGWENIESEVHGGCVRSHSTCWRRLKSKDAMIGYCGLASSALAHPI